MSTAAPGGISAALDHLITEHAAAKNWAEELARELETARERLGALTAAISATARLLPEDERATAHAALGPARAARAGTRTAALTAFLRTNAGPFTPSDLVRWLAEAGHPVRAPRDAARMLCRAEERGQVRRDGRGIYRAPI